MLAQLDGVRTLSNNDVRRSSDVTSSEARRCGRDVDVRAIGAATGIGIDAGKDACEATDGVNDAMEEATVCVREVRLADAIVTSTGSITIDASTGMWRYSEHT